MAAETGTVLWSFETGRDGPPAQFHGDALVTSEAVIVGSDSLSQGYLYSFGRSSGQVRWKVPMRGGVASQVYRWRDTVLATTLGGEVVAVDLATGALRWRRQAPEETRGTYSGDPVLAGDRFFVPWRPGLLDAFDAGTGELLWRRRLEATLNTSTALFGGEVVVGTRDGKLLRFDPATGGALGVFDPGPPGGVLYGDLVPAENCLTVLQAAGAKADSPELTGPFSVTCLRPDASQVAWEHPSDEQWSTLRPLVWEGCVIVGTENSLQALDLRDGGLRWDRSVVGVPRGLGASSKSLFVGTREGNLLALPWSTVVPGQASGPGRCGA